MRLAVSAVALATSAVLAGTVVTLTHASRTPDDTAVTTRPAVTPVAARATGPALEAAPGSAAGGARVARDADQGFPYYPYDGRFTFVRLQPKSGAGFGGGYGRRSREPPWAHDYPSAEHNLSKIVRELTFIRVRVEDWGGNILQIDDPRLSQYPVAYMSEPGYWSTTPEEADALRQYLLKGGFIIFDDFGGNRYGEMQNLVYQMSQVMPELQWVRLDATADIFDSFFQFDPDDLNLSVATGSYRGTPVFYGLYEDNDPTHRLVAVAADGGDFGEFWEFSDRGYYPVDISNEAYKVAINYIIYPMTH